MRSLYRRDLLGKMRRRRRKKCVKIQRVENFVREIDAMRLTKTEYRENTLYHFESDLNDFIRFLFFIYASNCWRSFKFLKSINEFSLKFFI